MIVQKQVFELDRLDLFCGTTLRQVRVGYETYGTPSPSKDNAILICHHFSGTSHAAGRYNEIEEIPGYWDAVIGPGKPFDTQLLHLSGQGRCPVPGRHRIRVSGRGA